MAREEGDLQDIRAILGNDKAIKAYRDGKFPFADGTIIARLAWSHEWSEENNEAFGRPQSFVAGLPKNGVQFMVKDSRKYASTGGWGYGHFDDGKTAGDAVLKTCFPCHAAIKDRDSVLQKLGGAKLILSTAPNSKAMSSLIDGLGPNGKLIVVGAAFEPIEVTPVQLIGGSRALQGWAAGTPTDSEDTLRFAELTGVRPMIETYPLEKAAEAYAKASDGARHSFDPTNPWNRNAHH